jgi:hypothetical protein
MDDRKLALHVELRKAVVVDRTYVEIAAIAGAGQVDLGNAFGGDAGEERVEGLRELAAPVVVQELGIGDQDTGPAPDPILAEPELSGGLHGAAE